MYPPFVWSLWLSCSLVGGLFSLQPLSCVSSLATTPFFILSFIFFGCQFHCPILYALKLTRTSKSFTLAKSDNPNFKAEFSIDTRWIPVTVRVGGQQWVTSITLQFGLSVSLTQGSSHRAYICAHGAHGPKEPNLKLKKPNFELKNLTPELMLHVSQTNPLSFETTWWINLTNIICIYYRFYFYYVYF